MPPALSSGGTIKADKQQVIQQKMQSYEHNGHSWILGSTEDEVAEYEQKAKIVLRQLALNASNNVFATGEDLVDLLREQKEHLINTMNEYNKAFYDNDDDAKKVAEQFGLNKKELQTRWAVNCLVIQKMDQLFKKLNLQK